MRIFYILDVISELFFTHFRFTIQKRVFLNILRTFRPSLFHIQICVIFYIYAVTLGLVLKFTIQINAIIFVLCLFYLLVFRIQKTRFLVCDSLPKGPFNTWERQGVPSAQPHVADFTGMGAPQQNIFKLPQSDAILRFKMLESRNPLCRFRAAGSTRFCLESGCLLLKSPSLKKQELFLEWFSATRL